MSTLVEKALINSVQKKRVSVLESNLRGVGLHVLKKTNKAEAALTRDHKETINGSTFRSVSKAKDENFSFVDG